MSWSPTEKLKDKYTKNLRKVFIYHMSSSVWAAKQNTIHRVS